MWVLIKKKVQQSDSDDFICPAPAGAPDLQEDDGNHYLKGANDWKELVNKLIPDSIGKDIEKACQSVYPLYDVFIRKEKMLKKPKFELGKLMELHIEGSSSGKAAVGETGAKVERDDGYKPPVQESV